MLKRITSRLTPFQGQVYKLFADRSPLSKLIYSLVIAVTLVGSILNYFYKVTPSVGVVQAGDPAQEPWAYVSDATGSCSRAIQSELQPWTLNPSLLPPMYSDGSFDSQDLENYVVEDIPNENQELEDFENVAYRDCGLSTEQLTCLFYQTSQFFQGVNDQVVIATNPQDLMAKLANYNNSTCPQQ